MTMEVNINVVAEKLSDAILKLSTAIAGKETGITVPAPTPNKAAATQSIPETGKTVLASSVAKPPKYQFDDLFKASANLIRDNPNCRTTILAKVQELGVSSIRDIRPEQYEEFAETLLLMGAAI